MNVYNKCRSIMHCKYCVSIVRQCHVKERLNQIKNNNTNNNNNWRFGFCTSLKQHWFARNTTIAHLYILSYSFKDCTWSLFTRVSCCNSLIWSHRGLCKSVQIRQSLKDTSTTKHLYLEIWQNNKDTRYWLIKPGATGMDTINAMNMHRRSK